MPTSRGFLPVAAFVALALAPMPGAAQQPQPATPTDVPPRAMGERAPYRIAYDHLTGVVRLFDTRDRLVEQWETRLPGAPGAIVPVPPDRPVVVVVENANPLLYTYDLEVVPIAQGHTRACRDIGADFASRGVVVALGAYAGQAAALPDASRALASDDIVALYQQTEQRMATRGGSGATVSEEAMERALESIRAPVIGYVETVESVSRLSGTLSDSLRLVAELGDAMPVDSLLAALQASLDRHQSGLSDPARLPGALRRAHAQVLPQLETLDELETSIVTGRYGGLRSDPAAREVQALSRRVEAAHGSAQQGYHELRTDLLRLERARQRTRQAFTVAASPDFRRITIATGAADGFDEVLRTREGRISIFTEPAVGLRCQVGLGFAFMQAPPDFSLDGSGVVVDREADETRTAPALLILLSAPQVPLLGLVGGIGLGEDKVPDFYLGGSLTFLDPVMLNAGVVWQRERRLSEGVELGQPLADPTVLDDLPRSFRSSLFFGVSLVR